jgi:RNA polymerase sigma-70 factor (ECF subfamily)
VLVLHDMEELSPGEIARVLNLSEGNVRVRLHRARVFVRNELSKAGTRKHPTRPRAASAPLRPLRCKKLFAELSNYLDQQLDDSMCDEIESHMDGCSPCQVFLASLERTVEQCRRHQPARLNPARAAQIRASLAAEYRRAADALSSRKP